MPKLILLFTLVPLVELSLLLYLDDLVGLWPTIAVVLVTGVVGAWLARMEGLRVLSQWRRSLVRGTAPEDGVLGGVLVLVGGVLLVTPGVLTDLLGLLLLIPPTRRLIAKQVRKRIEKKLDDGTVQFVNFTSYADQGAAFRHSSTVPANVVMDVDAEDLDLDDDDDEEDDLSRRVLH